MISIQSSPSAGSQVLVAGATVLDPKGQAHGGLARIGADGVKNVLRAQYVNHPPRITGHVAYRAAVDKRDFPENLQSNAASGPGKAGSAASAR